MGEEIEKIWQNYCDCHPECLCVALFNDLRYETIRYDRPLLFFIHCVKAMVDLSACIKRVRACTKEEKEEEEAAAVVRSKSSQAQIYFECFTATQRLL